LDANLDFEIEPAGSQTGHINGRPWQSGQTAQVVLILQSADPVQDEIEDYVANSVYRRHSKRGPVKIDPHTDARLLCAIVVTSVWNHS
jgi:hypothetical protein